MIFVSSDQRERNTPTGRKKSDLFGRARAKRGAAADGRTGLTNSVVKDTVLPGQEAAGNVRK